MWSIKINGKKTKMTAQELEKNMSEKTKSRFNEPVYSATYDNSGWPERDELPTVDPVGDVDESSLAKKTMEAAHALHMPHLEKDEETYFEMMRRRLLNPEGKNFGKSKAAILKDFDKSGCCSNPQKYKNVISKNLQFYSCKNCGADLGDC
jgi:hypothetical protein